MSEVIFVAGCTAGLTPEAAKVLRGRAWQQIDYGTRRNTWIDASQLIDLLAIAQVVPELVEALTGLLEAHAVPSTGCNERPAYERALAVLTKATGERL